MDHNNETILNDLDTIVQQDYAERLGYEFEQHIAEALTHNPAEDIKTKEQEDLLDSLLLVTTEYEQKIFTTKGINLQGSIFELKDLETPISEQEDIYEEPKTKRRDVRYSVHDPVLFEKLKSAIRERKDNAAYPQELFERCYKFSIERLRNTREQVCGTTLNDIKRGRHNIGSIKYMLEEEQKSNSITVQEETSEDKERKEIKRKYREDYRKEQLVNSEEDIIELSRKNTLIVIGEAKDKYDTVFQIFKEYYSKKLLKEGFLRRRNCETFQVKLKKLLKNILKTKEFHEITPELLKLAKQGKKIKWTHFIKKYSLSTTKV